MNSPSISMKKLQAADRVLGRMACTLLGPLRHWRRRSVEPPREILLIKFWGIGSLQLLTPAVRSLRERFPDARITLLTLRGNAEFAIGLGCFDSVETLDVTGSGWARVLWRIARLFRQVRGARFDRVYDFEFFTRFSAVVSLFTGAPVVRGFASPTIDRGDFHTATVPFNRYWHVARNFRALAEGENGHEIETDAVTRFDVSEGATRALRNELERRGLAANRPFVVLNPNAGELSLERRWPAENFARLAKRLIVEDELAVVLIGTKSEAAYVQAIEEAIDTIPRGTLFNLSGSLTVSQLAALLRSAECAVSNDSGPMHIAAALGTATLGLFGPETPLMYAPIGRRVRVLWEPPVCSPCINVHDNKVANCIHGRPECLVNLTVERVHEELRFLRHGAVLRPVGGELPIHPQTYPPLAPAE